MADGYPSQYLTAVTGALEDYLIVCGASYALFYFVLRRLVVRRKITQAPTGLQAPALEIVRATVSNLLGRGPFILALAYLAHVHVIPSKLIYLHVSDRGVPYFVLTIAFDVLLFDLWFYTSHRFLLHSR